MMRASYPDEEIVLDWCDRHAGYVTAGETLPYTPGSPYRLCNRCMAALTRGQAAWARLRARGIDETQLRAMAGDR